MLTQTKPSSQVRAPQVWEEATARAEIGDTFRIPFAPIFQVVEKEILKSGRVWLKVKLNSCSYTEEWVLEPEPAEQPHLAPVDTPAAQPAAETLDSTSYQSYPNWDAMEEFKQGRAHGLGDARRKLEPMCTDTSCPYSTGYCEGYNGYVEPQPEVVKPPQWSVTYNRKWDWYIVWVGDRAIDRAANAEEGEKKAQQYIVGNKFWQEHRQAVLAAYAS